MCKDRQIEVGLGTVETELERQTRLGLVEIEERVVVSGGRVKKWFGFVETNRWFEEDQSQHFGLAGLLDLVGEGRTHSKDGWEGVAIVVVVVQGSHMHVMGAAGMRSVYVAGTVGAVRCHSS